MLNKNYWESRYNESNTGWDIGYASTPLTVYFDQLSNKNLEILIPGAGFGHEALYLADKGFKNITVLDISSIPLSKIKNSLPDPALVTCIEEDFFQHKLLKPGGKLAGVLFNFPLNEQGPPYGGSYSEYQNLFSEYFSIKTLEPCYNSIKPRQGNELFFIFESK